MTSRTFIKKTARRTRRYGITLVGAAGLSLASAGLAVAQQPSPAPKPDASTPAPKAAPAPKPDASTPAPKAAPAAPSDLSVSVTGEARGSGDAREGDRYEYRVHIVNDGPGAAKNVRLLFSPPDEYDSDDMSEGCGNSATHHGMDCLMTELKPGDDAQLVFRGRLGESGTQNTWGVVMSDSVDLALDNNTARHRIDVENGDRNNHDND